VLDIHGDEPIVETARPARGNPNKIVAARSHRPTGQNERLPSEVARLRRAVDALGQRLNRRVIAEGVETDEHLAFLRDNNCDEKHGCLFSKPAPPAESEDLYKHRPTWPTRLDAEVG
jgi:predicted signal transduction protein with EAL and GGDEF domain